MALGNYAAHKLNYMPLQQNNCLIICWCVVKNVSCIHTDHGHATVGR